MTDQDARTLVVVTGWLNVLVGAIHGFLAVAMLVAGYVFWPRVETFLADYPEIETAINQVAVLTVLLVVLIVALSAAEIMAAVFLFRHNEGARRLSVGIGVCNLLHAPFGTAVGAFTVWTLTRQEVRRLFI